MHTRFLALSEGRREAAYMIRTGAGGGRPGTVKRQAAHHQKFSAKKVAADLQPSSVADSGGSAAE